jgi:hypothetical protein
MSFLAQEFFNQVRGLIGSLSRRLRRTFYARYSPDQTSMAIVWRNGRGIDNYLIVTPWERHGRFALVEFALNGQPGSEWAESLSSGPNGPVAVRGQGLTIYRESCKSWQWALDHLVDKAEAVTDAR